MAEGVFIQRRLEQWRSALADRPDALRDLDEHAELAADHPVLRVLAGESASAPELHKALAGEPVPDEQDLDLGAEAIVSVLDADTSQRLCLEAAARGHSFAIVGASGTGKTQTAVNLVADALSKGKTVLCVGATPSACRDLHERLREAGLGDFVLALQGANLMQGENLETATIAAELDRCMQLPSPPAPASDAALLIACRDQLNRYVQALHATREPLARSAWSVLEELASLADVPVVPLGLPAADLPTADLPAARGPGVPENQPTVLEVTPGWLHDARLAVERWQQLAQISAQADLPWRGFKADKYNQQLREEVLALVDKARQRLDKVLSAAEHFAGQIGFKAPVARLIKASELSATLPGIVPAAWLKSENPEALAQDVETCVAEFQASGQSRAPLTARYGPSLWQLPEGTAKEVETAWRGASPLLARGDDRGAGLLSHQQQLRGWAADTQKRIPAWITDAHTLEKWIAIPLPHGAGSAASSPAKGEGKIDPSPNHLRLLLRLVNLCQAEHAPERPWAHQPQALEEAKSHIAVNKPVFAEFHRRRQQLLESYKEDFFELELDRLADTFAAMHQGWLRAFNGQYRRDRRAIKRRSQSEELPATVAEDLVQARALMRERARLDGEQETRRAILGRYEHGLDTDYDGAEKATRVAAESVEVAQKLGAASMPARLLDVLCAGTPAPEKIRAAAKRLHDSFGAWLHATQELKARLPTDALPGTNSALDDSALSALLEYAKSLQSSLNRFGTLTDSILGQAPQRPADAAALVADLKQAEQVRSWESTQPVEGSRWQARFGPAFAGPATDFDVLRRSVAWARRVRDFFAPEPPPERFVQLAAGGPSQAPSSRDLRHALEQYEHALHSIELRFDAPGPLLDGKPLRSHPPEAVKPRLGQLRDTIADLPGWIDWRHLPERMAHLGLETFWQSLQTNPPPAGQLAPIFTKSFLTAWWQAVCGSEPALASFHRGQHEKIAAEFCDLDRAWQKANRARVAHEVGRRRPPGDSAAAVRTALQSSASSSIQALLQAHAGLLLSLKPCVLVDAETVALLPPKLLAFDVVLIDNAERMALPEAVPCICRGRQVVVLGDELRLADEHESPDNLMGAWRKHGLDTRELACHYRSRHDALFAFINQHYGDDRLAVFPAARRLDAERGVKFMYVKDGAFDPARRVNEREVAAAANFVLDHVQARREQTLRVVTLEEGQAHAIQGELNQRAAKNAALAAKLGSGAVAVSSAADAAGEVADVVVLSLALGRDAKQRLTDFGPLQEARGSALLQALLTGARQKMIVLSSLSAPDIDKNHAERAPAIRLLRQFLEYAEACHENGLPAYPPRQLGPLAKDILQVLSSRGIGADTHVGAGSFVLDLAVVGPQAAGYVLGIALDGPAYQAAATARERDRLRTQVLQSLGWKLHRVWAQAWVNDRDAEIERLVQAVESAGGARGAAVAPPHRLSPAKAGQQ